jgi:hypothetical protein
MPREPRLKSGLLFARALILYGSPAALRLQDDATLRNVLAVARNGATGLPTYCRCRARDACWQNNGICRSCGYSFADRLALLRGKDDTRPAVPAAESAPAEEEFALAP